MRRGRGCARCRRGLRRRREHEGPKDHEEIFLGGRGCDFQFAKNGMGKETHAIFIKQGLEGDVDEAASCVVGVEDDLVAGEFFVGDDGDAFIGFVFELDEGLAFAV